MRYTEGNLLLVPLFMQVAGECERLRWSSCMVSEPVHADRMASREADARPPDLRPAGAAPIGAMGRTLLGQVIGPVPLRAEPEEELARNSSPQSARSVLPR